MERPKKKELRHETHLGNVFNQEDKDRMIYNQACSDWEAYHTQEIEKLKKGENEWWRKRWVNNDVGKELFEIRKKWLTAYQCAVNYQERFEKLEKQILETHIPKSQLPSENQLGILIYSIMRGLNKVQAIEYWTDKHIKTESKKLSSKIAKAIRELYEKV